MSENYDILYMRRAIELAGRGSGFVNPNPLVGAVIVKENRIIGEGWHERYGAPHAERNALKSCAEPPEGATLYVSLEPCCHYGKTPPCTEAIIEHKIAKVVVALADPNPKVAGKGIELLREAGIDVVVGVEEGAVREQNRIFLKYITTRQPWVTLKTAMTLDGKIATTTGNSRWVTGPEARALVHEWRHLYTGIMAGIGTVLADDPMLNVRIVGQEIRQPVRIIVDSHASTPLDSRLAQTAGAYRTIIAHTKHAPAEKIESLQSMGVETLCCEECMGKTDLHDLIGQLGAASIDAILLEGGGTLNYSFLKAGLVDEVFAFIAPKFIGGKDAKTPVEGDGIKNMSEAIGLHSTTISIVGDDILIKGRLT